MKLTGHQNQLGSVALNAVVATLLAGCLASNGPLSLGAHCTSNTSCKGDLRCVYGLCRSACVFARDCPPLQSCVRDPAHPENRVCTHGDEGQGGTGECPLGMNRGPDGACHDVCDVTADELLQSRRAGRKIADGRL